MYPIFVIKFSGVSDLQGVKVPDFPLTLLVIVTTVLRYRAACDVTCFLSNRITRAVSISVFFETTSVSRILMRSPTLL